MVRSAQRGPFLPPSDLQVPSSTHLWGAPQRHPWFPTPAWGPCLDPFPAQELPGALGPSRPGRASSPDPRSPCPVTLPARPLSAGLRVTGSPPLALGTRAFTCLELAQHAVRVEGCTPPPQSCHPGPPWNGVSSDHRAEPISPSSPAPLACSKRAGGPAPGPFPARCGFALDAAANTAPAPGPGSRAALLLLPRPSATAGPSVPQALLDTPCTGYPVPTRSPSSVSSLYYIFIEEWGMEFL